MTPIGRSRYFSRKIGPQQLLILRTVEPAEFENFRVYGNRCCRALIDRRSDGATECQAPGRIRIGLIEDQDRARQWLCSGGLRKPGSHFNTNADNQRTHGVPPRYTHTKVPILRPQALSINVEASHNVEDVAPIFACRPANQCKRALRVWSVGCRGDHRVCGRPSGGCGLAPKDNVARPGGPLPSPRETDRPMPKQEVQYRDLVERFEKVVRDTMGAPVGIHELCRTTGLNQRTLLRAMRAIHGMTSCHYLRALRLAEARQAFLCAATPAASVTEVALRCGFRELGRFAVDYRATFGESPSDTLRRTSAGQSARSTVSCHEQ